MIENAVTFMRGPALTFVCKNESYDEACKTAYYPDALIILRGEKISAYGPAKSLFDKLPNGAVVKKFKNCRIIKTFINSK